MSANSEKTLKAVVLTSGGLDSSTCLAIAKQEGYACYSLSFDYGQRHRAELHAAEQIARELEVKDHQIVRLDMSGIGGSALIDTSIDVPEKEGAGIPVTYVPARNTIFLSYALAWAEVLKANAIFIGVNALDYSGYPDCRPEFIHAFQQMTNLATKVTVEGGLLEIKTPLIHLTKAQIIELGHTLGVDYALTVSCYQADESGAACGRCDSCRFRQKGFAEAGVSDPTRYQ